MDAIVSPSVKRVIVLVLVPSIRVVCGLVRLAVAVEMRMQRKNWKKTWFACGNLERFSLSNSFFGIVSFCDKQEGKEKEYFACYYY